MHYLADATILSEKFSSIRFLWEESKRRKRDQKKKLWQLDRSVTIIIEVQMYRNKTVYRNVENEKKE